MAAMTKMKGGGRRKPTPPFIWSTFGPILRGKWGQISTLNIKYLNVIDAIEVYERGSVYQKPMFKVEI